MVVGVSFVWEAESIVLQACFPLTSAVRISVCAVLAESRTWTEIEVISMLVNVVFTNLYACTIY
jgi:hypothetical protein